MGLPPVTNEYTRYQTISWQREMNPVIAARAAATGKASSPTGRFAAGAKSRFAAVLDPRICNISTAKATNVLNPAASFTEPDIPNLRMVTSAASQDAAAEPSVLTKYKLPTERPTFPGKSHQIGDQHGKRGAHQDRRRQNQAKRNQASLDRRSARREGCNPVEQTERNNAKGGDTQLDQSEDHEQRRVAPRKPSSYQAAQAQAQHESADHHGHRLNVDTVYGEQRPLPDDLIEQGGEAGRKEKDVEPPVSGLFRYQLGSIAGRQRVERE